MSVLTVPQFPHYINKVGRAWQFSEKRLLLKIISHFLGGQFDEKRPDICLTRISLTILTQPYNKVTELARDPRPVSAFSDTFFILANQSSDPAIQQLSASWIVHYEFEEAIKNSSESKVVMCESSSSLQYILRSIQRLLSNLNNI